jgi:ABC-type amino acid transport system permease subunit
VLKLRPGVKFHDGEPFNAEAVRFNIERHLNTPGSFRKSEIGEIKSVDVINDLTVRLNLSEPLVPLLAALTDRAGMIISPKAAKELGDRFGTKPVCAGPYKFVERVAQGKIVGERFADYWDKGNIHIDRVEFLPITDSTARLASLRSGDLHMIERVSPSDLAQIRADAKLKVVGVAELGYQMIPLNVNNGPKGKGLGADPRIRQAIDLAIDRETIVKTIFANEYIPGNQFVSPASPYYNAKFPVQKRDVTKARQLLQAAGASNLAFTLIVPLRSRIPVSDLLASKLPVTIELAACSMLVALLLGLPAGIISATRKGTPLDFTANLIALSGLSVPHFWLGIMLILLFAVRLGWLPASGYATPWEDPLRNLTTLLLPSLVLGTGVAGVMMRHTRSAMMQTLDADYVRTARAKSVPERLVVLKHALRNALIPVITLGALNVLGDGLRDALDPRYY